MAQDHVYRHDLGDDAARRLYARGSADAAVAPTGAGIRVTARGPDPFLFGPKIDVELAAARVVQITADFLGHPGQALKIYFATDQAPSFCEEQSLEVAAPAATGPVTLTFDFGRHLFWRGRELTLRLDLERFGMADGVVELREVVLLSAATEVTRVALPALPPGPREEFHLGLELAGAGLAIALPEMATTLGVLDSPHPRRFAQAARDGSCRVAYRLVAYEPGVHTLTLSPLGARGSLAADLWARDPSAAARDLGRGLALAGEIVWLRIDGQVAARLVPELVLVALKGARLRRVSVPLKRGCEERTGGVELSGMRRVDGIEVKARLSVGPATDEDGVVRLPFETVLELSGSLPLLDVAWPPILLGDPAWRATREMALLPGVEMRGRDDATLELMPEPFEIAWPAALLEQRGMVYAARWHGAEVQAAWRSPDTWAGTTDHVLALHGPVRDAGRALAAAPVALSGRTVVGGEVIVATRPRALAALATSLCPVPPPADPEAMLRRSLAALDGVFRGKTGLTLPRVGAAEGDEYFDPRSCLSLLAAERRGWYDGEGAAKRELARHLETDGAGRLPLQVGLLFPDQLSRCIVALEQECARLVSEQGPDGTWPPRLPPGCQHALPDRLARTAAAVAEPVARLLQASLLGLVDDEPVRRALPRLLDPGLLPTGAQAWEFAPTVPEVLGAAALADALALAGEAGLCADGVERAIDWLLLGLTFFRLRPEPGAPYPFACFPALGVTRAEEGGALWYRHAPHDQLDWRGVSCPWVGLRFAAAVDRVRAVARCAGLPKLAEVEPLLSRVVVGIAGHAASMMRDDGSLPDGFVLARGVETEPLYRAPLDVAWQSLAALGASPEMSWARHGGVAAVAIGEFNRTARGLELVPRLPGPQAVVVSGGRVVDHAGVELPATDLRDGLKWSLIDGAAVTIEPRP